LAPSLFTFIQCHKFKNHRKRLENNNLAKKKERVGYLPEVKVLLEKVRAKRKIQRRIQMIQKHQLKSKGRRAKIKRKVTPN